MIHRRLEFEPVQLHVRFSAAWGAQLECRPTAAVAGASGEPSPHAARRERFRTDGTSGELLNLPLTRTARLTHLLDLSPSLYSL